MRIIDLLNPKAIDLHGKAQSKAQVIDRLVELMCASGNIADPAEYKRCVLERERQGTTGIGEGVAIPHAKTSAVTKPGLAVMVVPDGVDFDALDGAPVRLLFLIAAPDTEDNVHLDVLGKLSVLLMDEGFRKRLIAAKSTQEFMQLVDQAESGKDAKEQAASESKPGSYRLLAVTACPTGIAHTYMAAEALENAAKDLGVTIKVETNGSGGSKNVLTRSEIRDADCIIIAADKDVETARFDGKPVIQTKVSNGINKAKELIERAVSGGVPVFHSEGGAPAENEEHESAGRRIYKHLMNGVSHMLPFVIGGGILIALAFLFDQFDINPSTFGSNTPFAAVLKKIGDTAFSMMLPVLAGFIAMSIGDRPALAVGFLGGLLARDGFVLNLSAQPGEFMVAGSSSGFLGALVAGFIAGYLVVGLRWLFSRLPKSLEGIKPVLLYPLLGILLMGAIMLFVINPPLSALNEWISAALHSMGNTSRVLLGILLGGMMAVDMGGPINKAAYVFGTAAIASGSYEIMAAVMIGGMTPPIAIALCSTFFKNRFTKRERSSALTNYIMGLSFITEGAIPFAAADPLRVIPSLVVGSAVAGGLSMFFNCTLRAPHGGIFVFPLVGNWPMYLVALAAGSVVSMFLLALLKKPAEDHL